MLLGLRTVIYPTKDVENDKEWWSGVTGIKPYFDEPFYVGFDIGGYELGLLPGTIYEDGPATYWGVESVEKAVDHFQDHGCTVYSEPQDVGDGIIVAIVKKPENQLIGLIYNPHFKADF